MEKDHLGRPFYNRVMRMLYLERATNRSTGAGGLPHARIASMVTKEVHDEKYAK